MDEIKLNLSAKFVKKLVAKIIKKAIQKQFGYKIDIQLNGVVVTADEDKIHIRADIEAETTKDELEHILRTKDLID